MKQSILIIEDEKTMRITLADALKEEGYTVYAAADGREGMTALREGTFSLVITDVRLPDLNGLDILRHVIRQGGGTMVIVMTAYGSIEDAVSAMRIGAYDYITKPFSLEEILLTVGRALDHQAAREENIRLKKELSTCFQFPNMIGESEAMQQVFSLLHRVARTDSTVLITGESGTGKELVATTIHYQSDRKDKPLVKVNCAALPEALIEAELFGYEKGAFTGAEKTKPGRFEMADGGTIFLDEIGDLPLLTQTKILRVIEERTVERLGGTKTIRVNVRILTATNKNLEKEVEAGRFREDLLFRLNVIPVHIPPLRERESDIPLLIEKFTERFNDRFGTSKRFDRRAVETLMQYSFPGNVRELQNIMERCIALAEEDVITVADLPPHVMKRVKGAAAAVLPLAEVVAEAERSHIERILRITGGNRSRAAGILGISRKTLWEKINHHRLEI
ncbi:MAG: sigma-54 dependent transcriptional regulator [Desulfobulbaceae bacterium]